MAAGAGKGRAVVAMSGGVDSSAAAALLAREGYEVLGVTMRLWTPELSDLHAEGQNEGCCALAAVEDARRVCGKLGIRHYVLNFRSEFREHVVDPFLAEYRSGRTPNPCIACNDEIKFRLLLRRALLLGADYLATGHHARIARGPDGPSLLRGRDEAKDQSYFLYRLTPKQLDRLLFPIGEITKPEARELVRDLVPRVSAKGESQDVCFVPDGDYRRFVATESAGHGADTSGEIVHVDGRVLGRHRGIERFTVGQRRRLGVSVGHRLVVVRIEPEARRVVVGEEQDLMHRRVRVTDLSWTCGHPPEGTGPFVAKLRYNSEGSPAMLTETGPGSILLEFDDFQRAPAPGQAAVLYDGDLVLGGGIIAGP